MVMSPNESRTEELVQKIPPLRELFSLDSRESREAWVKANPNVFVFLGTSAYWFEKEGRWDVVRELNQLRLTAAEAFDDNKLPSKQVEEVKERLLAEAHESLGSIAERDGAYFVALQERLAGVDYLERSIQRRVEMGLSPFSEKDQLFGGGGDGLRAHYYLRVHDSYLRVGEQELARQYERKAYEAIAKSTNLDNYSVARTFEAIEAMRYGARKEARDILKRAIEHVFGKPFPRDEYMVPLAAMVHLYVLAARYAAEDRDFEESFRFIDQAIAINTGKNQWVYCIDCLLQRAETALNATNEPEMRRSLTQLDALISEKRMETLIPADQLYRLRMAKAEHAVMAGGAVERVRGLKEAEQHFSGAIQIVRELRARAFSPSEKLSISAQQRNAYQGMLDVVGELFAATNDISYVAKGLRIAEQSGAQLFLERAAESRMRNIPTDAADEISILSMLGHTRSKIARSTYEGETTLMTPDQRIAMSKELEELIRERDGLIAWIRNKNPALAYAVAPDAVEFGDIQALLDQDQRVLYYAATRSSVLAWLIGKNEAVMRQLPLDMNELARRIGEFRQLLMEPSEEAAQGAFEIGLNLHTMLVAPILPHGGSVQRLFLITSGPLSSIPFETLVAGGKYLVEQAEITYAPSLSILALLLRSKTLEWQGPPWFLGFGDPKYGDVGEIDGGKLSALGLLCKRGLDLSPLPGSRLEVESINKLFGPGKGRVMLSEQCTKESLTALHLTDYAFMHFAVHGFLPGEIHEVEQAALALSPSAASDGLLTAQEVSSLNVRSYLTVLSACNTGMGPTVASEGMISLTRAMLSSGSDHVLASLWEVSDTATAMLMIDLYRHLLAGERPAQALRKAKLSLMEKVIAVRLRHAGKGIDPATGDQADAKVPGRLPCFWGAFLVHGGNTSAQFVEPVELGPLGSDRAPVKAGGAVGQRAYLSRLRSKDGSTPKWQRRGSIGVGIYGHIIDLYDVAEADGNVANICMDMYYPGYKERRPVPGFTLVP
jgi:CHAT domain-containing protein/tetratricopeptide (TPR) repeat protein